MCALCEGLRVCCWQGSEAEIKANAVHESPRRTKVLARRMRRHFGRPCAFTDRPAEELWAPTGMQYRPPPDLDAVVNRMETDAAVQVRTGSNMAHVCRHGVHRGVCSAIKRTCTSLFRLGYAYLFCVESGKHTQVHIAARPSPSPVHAHAQSANVKQTFISL